MEIAASNPLSGSLMDPSNDADGRIPSRTLTQDDFLKLVVAQMTTQDPMNPRKDTEFIAQMAQFSALEQSKSMQKEMAQLRADQLFLQANALLGRLVELQEPEGTSGAVTAIHVVEGMPKIVVEGAAYDLNQVISVAPATTAAT
jgi:flagellar basal-body rod modification protein FlgD